MTVINKVKETILSPSRVAVGLTAVAAFATVQFGNSSDWNEVDVASVVLAIVIAGYKWLDGRSKWETAQQFTTAGKTGRK